MVRWAAAAALMLSMAAPAGADQRPPKNRHLLWLSVGRFSPVSATAREAFGESRPVLDIELFRPRTRRGPRLDLVLSTRALTRETQGFFFAV